MQPTRFWTTPKKVIVTILAAVVWTRVLGCFEPPPVQPPPSPHHDPVRSHFEPGVDAVFGLAVYAEYNDTYFSDKLPLDITVSMDDTNPDAMAETGCNQFGQNCQINFNARFVTTQRVLRGTMIHEMCHIAVWTKTLERDRPAGTDKTEYDHGRAWRTCMLAADAKGVFREINIDYYHEK